jgi:hypothetical protein
MLMADWITARALFGAELFEKAAERARPFAPHHMTADLLLASALGVIWERLEAKEQPPMSNARAFGIDSHPIGWSVGPNTAEPCEHGVIGPCNDCPF